jgi:hypothetical protein
MSTFLKCCHNGDKTLALTMLSYGASIEFTNKVPADVCPNLELVV